MHNLRTMQVVSHHLVYSCACYLFSTDNRGFLSHTITELSPHVQSTGLEAAEKNPEHGHLAQCRSFAAHCETLIQENLLFY